MNPENSKRNRYPNVTVEDIVIAISAQPGITAQELSELSTLPIATVYNRIAKLRNMMRIKTVQEGGQSHYYPFNFATVEVPGMDKTPVPLRVGEDTVKARTLSPEELKKLLETPTAPTKYAELLGYLDRINVGEAGIFDSKELEPDAARTRIRTWFKENKKFSVVVHGQHVIIERTL